MIVIIVLWTLVLIVCGIILVKDLSTTKESGKNLRDEMARKFKDNAIRYYAKKATSLDEATRLAKEVCKAYARASQTEEEKNLIKKIIESSNNSQKNKGRKGGKNDKPLNDDLGGI